MLIRYVVKGFDVVGMKVLASRNSSRITSRSALAKSTTLVSALGTGIAVDVSEIVCTKTG